MESKTKLVKLIEKHIEAENRLVTRIGEMEKMVTNAAARLLLSEMRLDSQKHAGVLKGILKVLDDIPPSQTLWDYDFASYVDERDVVVDIVKRELENHVKMESEVMAHVEEEISHTSDEGLRLLLQHILEDERKHHKILETIIQHIRAHL